MPSPLSIFLDFNLPNATTWFYFSFLLAMALFFKFTRLLSVRNLDVVMVFLLVPGFLAVQASRPQPTAPEKEPAVQFMSLIGHGALADPADMAVQVAQFTHQCGPALERPTWLWFGYLWILLGSVYFFGRCLLDLTLVQRPALAPNLQTSGLGWLAGALMICLLAVAYRQVEREIHPQAGTEQGQAAPALPPADRAVIAVAILWRDWPAWAVAALAFACHLGVVTALALIAWRHFQDLAAGMAAVAFYFLLPYTGMSMGQIQHVLPMALFLAAVLAYRSPTLAGAVLGLATATTYFPLFTLPIWLSFYRERGMGRFLAAFLLTLGLGLALVGMALWLHGELADSISEAMLSAAWQPWKIPATTIEGFWTGVHWAYRIPVFLLFLSFVIVTMFWPAPKNLAHVIALSTAVFISLQWWCADQGGAYILWYMPLMLLMVFRPNLQDRVALPIVAETDWLAQAQRWCVRMIRRAIRRPEPAAGNPV